MERSNVVDLPRERRLRAIDAELAEALEAVDGERTAAMLAGQLPCPELELDEMEDRPLLQRTVRLPEEIWERLEAVKDAINADPQRGFFGDTTTSEVLRVAVQEGLEVLEKRFGYGKGKGKTKLAVKKMKRHYDNIRGEKKGKRK